MALHVQEEKSKGLGSKNSLKGERNYQQNHNEILGERQARDMREHPVNNTEEPRLYPRVRIFSSFFLNFVFF